MEKFDGKSCLLGRTQGASLPPALASHNIETPSVKFADVEFIGTKKGKILVAFESGFGTTKEVAEQIGRRLWEQGASVDVKWVKNVKTLKEYNFVIVGSAIQYDTWMPGAVTFIKEFEKNLEHIPVAYFFTCLALAAHKEKGKGQAGNYKSKILAMNPKVRPLSIGCFAGVLDYSKLPFLFRYLARVFFLILGVEEGDHRDFAGIKNWTDQLEDQFNNQINEQNKTEEKA